MEVFLFHLKHYVFEILPALAFGFFLSGLAYEFLPTTWVKRYLGEKNFKAILLATLVGILLPICCWGVLPVAVSFYKKGSRLGPLLAFLVATPATSLSALAVTYKLLGLGFTVYIFFSVVIMGLFIGLIGNRFSVGEIKTAAVQCSHCKDDSKISSGKKLFVRLISVFRFAYLQMPKEIGLEILVGIFLAAAVVSFVPLGLWIKNNLSGSLGYVFSLVFGLLTYICSTATVPLVDAFIQQGLNIGAAMTLLLVGPITSYGTILVLKKEFGIKILLFYLVFISFSSLLLGYIFFLVNH